MSDLITKIRICPHCGKAHPAKQWRVMDTGKDPLFRQRILAGTMFLDICPKCQAAEAVEYDTLYADPENGLYIALAVTDSSFLDARVQMDLNMESDPDVREALQKTERRVVHSAEELKEKVRIFEDGKDDRIVELVKYTLLAGMKQEYADLTSLRYTEEGYCALADGQIKEVKKVPESVYEMTRMQYEPLLQSEAGQDLVVDAHWVEHFLRRQETAAAAPEKTGIVNEFMKEFSFVKGTQEGAKLVREQWDSVWKEILSHWHSEHENKPSMHDLDASGYRNPPSEVLAGIAETLRKQKCAGELIRLGQTLPEDLDLTGEPRDRHAAMYYKLEGLRLCGNTDAAERFLTEWKEAEPESAYRMAAEIDYWRLSGDLTKAAELADRYLDAPMREDGDDFLLDVCEKTYAQKRERGGLKKVFELRKKQLQR